MKQQFKELDLSTEFMEHFKGFMLGDGSLTNIRKSKHSASFLLKNKNLDYLEWVKGLFEKEDIECKIKECSKGSFPGSKQCYEFETKFYPAFSQLEKAWYRYNNSGKRSKTIPVGVNVEPNGLLQWFIGDGYVVNHKGVPQRVQFCTDRYTAQEVVYLQFILLYNYGIETRVADRNRIVIRKSQMKKFFEVLPECPVDSFLYKWSPVRDIV